MKVFLTISLLVLAAVGCFLVARRHSPLPNLSVGLGNAVQSASKDEPSLRRVAALPKSNRYRLSLVPGGVSGISDFRLRVESDPVLAAKFSNFDWASAQIIELHNTTAFVSFRRGDKILWTRHEINIPAGTQAITDGHQTILMRCGNLISFTPQTPSEDLPPGTLEVPEPPAIEPPLNLQPPVETTEAFPPPPIGIYTPVVWGFGGGGIYTEKPVSTPEPSTLALLFGAAIIGFAVWFFGREIAKITKKADG